MFLEAGGQKFDDHRKTWILMQLLPSVVADKVKWEFEKFDGKPMALRTWVKERTQHLRWDDAPREKPICWTSGTIPGASTTSSNHCARICLTSSWRPS